MVPETSWAVVTPGVSARTNTASNSRNLANFIFASIDNWKTEEVSQVT